MQIDGIAMGNPISASLCNAFLAIKEQEWLRSCHQSYKPLLYLRYVDDTLLFFASRDHIDPFLAFLNDQSTSISFTKEEEKQGHIAFLDLKVSMNRFRAMFNRLNKLYLLMGPISYFILICYNLGI